MAYKTYTPLYDNTLIPKWYFEQELNEKTTMIGEIRTYGGSNLPDGWLLCNGDNVSRVRYKKLFETIGTTYGSGDGTLTFTLPTYADSVCDLGYKIIKY